MGKDEELAQAGQIVGEGANLPPESAYGWQMALAAERRIKYDHLRIMSDRKVKRAYENRIISRDEFISCDWIQDKCEADDPWIVNSKTGERRGGPMALPSAKYRK